MRSIALAALVSAAALFGGLPSSRAATGNCASDATVLAKAQLETRLVFPDGERLVVSDQWPDIPTSPEDPQQRITDTVYQRIQKLADKASYGGNDDDTALTLGKIAPERNPDLTLKEADRKLLEDRVKIGAYRKVKVTPKAITKVKGYEPKTATIMAQADVDSPKRETVIKYFTVPEFAAHGEPSKPEATDLKSLTSHYCIVQFSFKATLDKILWPLFDSPETAWRRMQLLVKWEPLAWDSDNKVRGKWIFVAIDHEAETPGAFKKDKVANAVNSLSLTR